MITQTELLKMISDQREVIQLEKQLIAGTDKSERTLNTLKRRLEFLVMCLAYIDTNPNEDYLKKEKDRLTKRMEAIDAELDKKLASYTFTKTPDAVKQFKKDHSREYHVDILLKQINALDFLLR